MWFNVRLWWSLRSHTLITQIRWWVLFEVQVSLLIGFWQSEGNLSHGYCLPQMALFGSLSFNSVVLKWPWNLKILSYSWFRPTTRGIFSFSRKMKLLLEVIRVYFLSQSWHYVEEILPSLYLVKTGTVQKIICGFVDKAYPNIKAQKHFIKSKLSSFGVVKCVDG